MAALLGSGDGGRGPGLKQQQLSDLSPGYTSQKTSAEFCGYIWETSVVSLKLFRKCYN